VTIVAIMPGARSTGCDRIAAQAMTAPAFAAPYAAITSVPKIAGRVETEPLIFAGRKIHRSLPVAASMAKGARYPRPPSSDAWLHQRD